MGQRRSLSGRDQHATEFAAILLRFRDAVGALSAALVDAEGETVDYAGTLDPFDIKIAAAEGALLLSVVRESSVPFWLDTQELLVRGAQRSLVLVPMGEGYCLVAVLPAHAFNVSLRAVQEAVRDLSREGGLPMPPILTRSQERWVRVEVRTRGSDRRRPESIWVDGRWWRTELLGRFEASGENSREVGFRVRLETGAELNLVRERLGIWYADHLPMPGG